MYPQNIDRFTTKLNNLDGNTYVIEETVSLDNGFYEGELKHDNISSSSIRVYTGTKLTGEKVENFIISTPSKIPWKKIIKVFSNKQVLYITYETIGDTVKAEDINELQDSVVNTQIELESYKSDGIIDGGTFK
ncbi:phosphoglucomutase [Clostridium rectalis]|uniref:phosphoglucomutase n=1 Tax=Clostridium rectalis TaxID=2040295 RepID=UPI000F638BFB|nr:phosphoglucomutase [Clostridium rectalis]